jgi:hypothetical protein
MIFGGRFLLAEFCDECFCGGEVSGRAYRFGWNYSHRKQRSAHKQRGGNENSVTFATFGSHSDSLYAMTVLYFRQNASVLCFSGDMGVRFVYTRWVLITIIINQISETSVLAAE